MTEQLRLERFYKLPAARVFEVFTRPETLVQWFGPASIEHCSGALDFSRPGPWNATMIRGDGTRFKVSGQVTTVNAPRLVAFTWGWHDANDRRGPESHVTVELTEEAGGTRMVLTHRDLADAEQVANHSEGWTSSLTKFEALLGP